MQTYQLSSHHFTKKRKVYLRHRLLAAVAPATCRLSASAKRSLLLSSTCRSMKVRQLRLWHLCTSTSEILSLKKSCLSHDIKASLKLRWTSSKGRAKMDQLVYCCLPAWRAQSSRRGLAPALRLCNRLLLNVEYQS